MRVTYMISLNHDVPAQSITKLHAYKFAANPRNPAQTRTFPRNATRKFGLEQDVFRLNQLPHCDYIGVEAPVCRRALATNPSRRPNEPFARMPSARAIWISLGVRGARRIRPPSGVIQRAFGMRSTRVRHSFGAGFDPLIPPRIVTFQCVALEFAQKFIRANFFVMRPIPGQAAASRPRRRRRSDCASSNARMKGIIREFLFFRKQRSRHPHSRG